MRADDVDALGGNALSTQDSAKVIALLNAAPNGVQSWSQDIEGLVQTSLNLGVVKLEAVVYWNNGSYDLGYDLMVKDEPDSPEWICYENLQEEVRYQVRNLEREMFQVLDRAVQRFGLSYTQCSFPKLSGAEPRKKPWQPIEQ